MANNFYVSEAGAGLKDGTTIANAWDTLANVLWDGADGVEVNAGDTLYVIDEVVGRLLVGVTGTAGSPVTIRGDAPGSTAGTITTVLAGNTGGTSFGQVGATNTYEWTGTAYDTTVAFFEGVRMTFVQWTTNAALTAAVMDTLAVNCFSVDPVADKLYIHRSGDEDPDADIADVTLCFSSAEQGIRGVDKSYITVKNLTITQTTRDGISFVSTAGNLATDIIVDNVTVTTAGGYGVFIGNSVSNTNAAPMVRCIVKNCTVSDCGRAGIKGSQALDRMIVEDNETFGNGWQQDANQISFGATAAGANPVDCIIRRNTSYNALCFEYRQNLILDVTDLTDNDGLGIEIGANCEDTIVEYNICYDNDSSGIKQGDSDGSIIRYNICYGNGKLAQDSGWAGGIESWSYEGVTIEFNTCYNNLNGITFRTPNADVETTVRFNICSSNDIYEVKIAGNVLSSGYAYVIDKNCYYNETNILAFNDGTDALNFADWQASVSDEANSIRQDPLFTDAVNDVFTLKALSPCPWAGYTGYTQFVFTLSNTGICNAALSKIGAKQIDNYGDVSETTTEALACRNHYDITRDALLRSHYWRFATARVELTQDSSDPDFEYDNQFLLPDDFMRLKSVFGNNFTATENTRFSFAIEGNLLLTDDDEVFLRYIKKVTDVTEFDSLFVEVFILSLALKLVAELGGGAPKLQQVVQQELAVLMRQVRTIDRQETNTIGRVNRRPWMEARLTRRGVFTVGDRTIG